MFTLMGSLVMLASLLQANSAASSWTGKAAFVKDNEIYKTEDGVTAIRLTHDGIPKSLPVWSKDGAAIAFLQEVKPAVALANLEVVSSGGKILAKMPIRPAASKIPGGMRFVESIQWVSETKIAVSGSINPTTFESLVVDIATGAEVDDVYDDQGGAVFSPDGNRFAYITGSSHFTPFDEQRPQLYVDQRKIYPDSNRHVLFETHPSWSPDSGFLAIVARTYDQNDTSLVVWQPGGTFRTYPLGTKIGATFTLFWIRKSLVISTGETTLQWNQDSNALRSVVLPPNDNLVVLKKALRTQLQFNAEKFGMRDADFWCASCLIAQLPRRRSLGSFLGP